MGEQTDTRIIGAISAREGRADRRALLAQVVALLAIGAAALLAVALYTQRALTTVEPFLVGVTEQGQVIVLGNLSHQWTLQEVWVRSQLVRWMLNISSLSTDPIAVQEARAEAWSMMLEPGKTHLHAFLLERPIKLVGQLAVTVTIERLEPTGNSRTWEVHYTETRTDMKTAKVEVKPFTGFLTVAIRKPEVVKGKVNIEEIKHLGIFIESFSLRPRLMEMHAKEAW
jgi:type IV secretory pathway TrbF-like protein